MPTDMFLKIEGPTIAGESQADGHRGEIDVTGWQWSQSQPTRPQGPIGSAGRVQVSPITIVKRVDPAPARRP